MTGLCTKNFGYARFVPDIHTTCLVVFVSLLKFVILRNTSREERVKDSKNVYPFEYQHSISEQ